MNFLEAHRIASDFQGGEELPFLLAMSGTPDQLELFLRAVAARRGRKAQPRTLPFDTLAQTILSAARADETEVFLLVPWDFVRECDWRSGLPRHPSDIESLRHQAKGTADRLARRRGARFLYIPAPIPPVLPDPVENASLTAYIAVLAQGVGARTLPAETFSLGGYLASGCPISGARLGSVAEAVIELVLAAVPATAKVLVTDLDDVLWSGVVAEDGLQNIAFGPEGAGYRHFLYQSLLLKLKNEGAVLAAVSRNDPELALAPLRGGQMLLKETDFICVLASYHAKSAQIRTLAGRLDLGLDAFVFVDDDPVELAEVAHELPEVGCLPFPVRDEGLPALFSELSHLFARTAITTEDRERTEMYRRRLVGIAPSDLKGADLTEFLRGLDMALVLHDRSRGDRGRAVQLINKTNQFNLNGRRFTDEEIAEVLADGDRLYSATLRDRAGSHGEILACLISPTGVVESLVMSCRVFQRRVEHAFLAWLAARESPPHSLDFSPTPRNEPIRQFLDDPAFSHDDDGPVKFEAAVFADGHAKDLALFHISESDHD